MVVVLCLNYIKYLTIKLLLKNNNEELKKGNQMAQCLPLILLYFLNFWINECLVNFYREIFKESLNIKANYCQFIDFSSAFFYAYNFLILISLLLFSPYLWTQSLYILCCLLYEGFLTPAELDPLSRRLSAYEKRPPPEVQGKNRFKNSWSYFFISFFFLFIHVFLVSILAETYQVQQELLTHDIEVQCIDEIDEVFSIQPASSFAKILSKWVSSYIYHFSQMPYKKSIELFTSIIL